MDRVAWVTAGSAPLTGQSVQRGGWNVCPAAPAKAGRCGESTYGGAKTAVSLRRVAPRCCAASEREEGADPVSRDANIDELSILSRRRALLSLAGAVGAVMIDGSLFQARAELALPKSKEELMQELQQSKKKLSPEEIEEKRAALAEERKRRLERIKEFEAEQKEKSRESQIGSNLRGNYYFNTNKLRYLPRIKLANDEMPALERALANQDWAEASRLVNGSIDDALLPLRLYTSSLSGQGLSLSVSFAKDMAASADVYEANLKKLKTAIKKKDAAKANASYQELNDALQKYRVAAKINTPDGGIGEISIDTPRVGSGFSNNNPALYMRGAMKKVSNGGSSAKDDSSSAAQE
ncbi:hypothetical protein FVE85_8633 [Porphyridium purpureum]|uniref:Uncharacterized protein n=1 Tax=Porphyridium purpureum TaxID=35688 RepID=A0A5J4YPF4_PORPP|nr:hypothetical protein FVE85_8633 [Porphyridium purpureum]|eukprot:POR7421..scf296_7